MGVVDTLINGVSMSIWVEHAILESLCCIYSSIYFNGLRFPAIQHPCFPLYSDLRFSNLVNSLLW